MSFGILDQEAMQALIQQRLDERRWWIIPVASPHAMALAEYIERTYYDGEKSKYFDMVMMTGLPGSSRVMLASIFFAHKEYMTMGDLRKLLKKPSDDGGEADLRDIIWTTDAPQEFFNWFCSTFRGDPEEEGEGERN